MYAPIILSGSNDSFNLEATNPVRPLHHKLSLSLCFVPSLLDRISLCSPGWVHGLTHGDPSASAFGALGLEACVSTPGQLLCFTSQSPLTKLHLRAL